MATDASAHLIGRPGSRDALATPALVLDLDAFERNLVRMAELMASAGCRLRPHAKAHKCAEAGRRQIAAGEVMAAAGIGDLLVTSPVAGRTMLERLIALNARSEGLIAVADHPGHVDALDAAARVSGKPMALLVDIDVGQQRTGVKSPEALVTLARRIDAAAGLRLRGVQAYYGHLQHVPSYREREAATAAARRDLRESLKALADAGIAAESVSGGGTGTHHIDATDGVFTEVQPGSYAFMDSQYKAVGLHPDAPRLFESALFVVASVVSANQPDYVVVNGGWKAFATEGAAPVPAGGAAAYSFMGDEHGAVVPPGRRPALGDTLLFKPPHCDPTVNLFSAFHCVHGDTLVEIWPIEARGY